ncbi:MAG: hypothetical protein JXQ29_08620 [Planctomycetes bacterium]|nr:hypothetical protein [Planctomycetota bacterium]
MRRIFVIGLLVGSCTALAAADDYATVGNIPFPQLNTGGANTAITFVQGQVAFLTQQAGYEDIYFLDPIRGVVLTHWTAPSPFAVISGLGDDGTLLYAVSSTTNSDKIAVIDLKGTVVTIFPTIHRTAAHYGSATDNTDLFVSAAGRLIYRMNRQTGALVQSFSVPTAPNTLFGLAHDTTKLLGVAPSTTGPATILGIDGTTGAELFNFTGPGVSGNSRGLGYGDDGNLYVGNQGDNQIYVMAPVPTPAGPIAVGQSTKIRIAAPIARLSRYVLAAAGSNIFGIRLPDGRRIPLDVDNLLLLSLNVPSLFQDFQGRLNASGVAEATLHVPAVPALRGLKFRLAFVTLDSLVLTGIRVISAARDVQID